MDKITKKFIDYYMDQDLNNTVCWIKGLIATGCYDSVRKTVQYYTDAYKNRIRARLDEEKQKLFDDIIQG